MKKLIAIYLISILVIVSSFMNVRLATAELEGSDYFFALTPGVNSMIALIIVYHSVRNIIIVESK